MVFDFSNFEDEAVGRTPSGWTQEGDNTGYSQVIDGSGVIRGEKSFRIGDDKSGGNEQLAHPVGDEDIRFTGRLGPTTPRGNSAGVYFYTDAGWWFAAWKGVNDDGDEFRLYFGTGSSPSDTDLTLPEIKNEADTQVGTILVDEPQLFEFVNPDTNLEFVLGEDTLYEHGSGFTGASTFRIRADDAQVMADAPEQISNIVYEEGSNVIIAGGSQDFVFDKGTLVADEGDSQFVYIEDSPIDVS